MSEERTERKPPSVMAMGLVSMVFFIAVGVLLAYLLRHENLLPRFLLSGTGAALGFGGAVACFVLAAAMYLLWPALRAVTNATAVQVVRVSLAQVGWAGLVFSVILPPIGEEVLFRGALQPSIGAGRCGEVSRTRPVQQRQPSNNVSHEQSPGATARALVL